jgi:hypothetical protein
MVLIGIIRRLISLLVFMFKIFFDLQFLSENIIIKDFVMISV